MGWMTSHEALRFLRHNGIPDERTLLEWARTGDVPAIALEGFRDGEADFDPDDSNAGWGAIPVSFWAAVLHQENSKRAFHAGMFAANIDETEGERESPWFHRWEFRGVAFDRDAVWEQVEIASGRTAKAPPKVRKQPLSDKELKKLISELPKAERFMGKDALHIHLQTKFPEYEIVREKVREFSPRNMKK